MSDTPYQPHGDANRPDPNRPHAGQATHTPSKDEIRETAREAGEAVKQNYRELRDDAVAEGREAMHAARDGAEAYAESQRRSAADSIAAIAEALRAGASTLEERDRQAIAGYSQTAADGVEQLSGWLRDKSLPELWREAEGYTRRQPLVTFGGALTAGFMLARFLKSSHEEPAPSQTGGDAYAATDPTRTPPSTPSVNDQGRAPAGVNPPPSSYDPSY